MIRVSADFSALVQALQRRARTIAARGFTGGGADAPLPDGPDAWRDPQRLWPAMNSPVRAFRLPRSTR